MKSAARVLVVEDDRAISRLLQLELEHRGMSVCCCDNGIEGLSAVNSFSPTMIILDILLPGMDGERLLREIRRRGVQTPVIMLTAKDAPRDKVRNLDDGADDYLTKPFVVEELLARIRALLRRVEPATITRIGDLVINHSTREVKRGHREIELTPREYQLLEILGRNARRTLTRDLLLERVWGDAIEADSNVVDVFIGYLRRKLETPDEPKLIHTVRGIGFVMKEDS